MKKKTMAFVMSLLMIVALVGVGFATWLITADSTQTAEGSITVDDVVDTRIKIEYEWGTSQNGTGSDFVKNEKANIVHFGKAIEKDGTPSPDYKWLTNDGTDSTMTLFLKVTLSNLIETVSEGGTTKTYGLDENGLQLALVDDNGKYKAALDAKYVGAIPEFKPYYLCKNANDNNYFLTKTSAHETTKGDNDIDVATEGGKAEVVIEVKFTWGEHFDYKNPFVYYNAFTTDQNYKKTETNIVEDAKTALGALNGLNAETFKITISGNAGSREDLNKAA